MKKCYVEGVQSHLKVSKVWNSSGPPWLNFSIKICLLVSAIHPHLTTWAGSTNGHNRILTKGNLTKGCVLLSGWKLRKTVATWQLRLLQVTGFSTQTILRSFSNDDAYAEGDALYKTDLFFNFECRTFAQAKYVMTGFNSKIRHETFAIAVHFLQNTQSLVISRWIFCRWWVRIVPRSKTHVHNHCSAHQAFSSMTFLFTSPSWFAKAF